MSAATRKPLCVEKYVIATMGGIAFCSLASMTTLVITGHPMEALLIALVNIPNTVVAALGGYLGGRMAQHTTVNTEQANLSTGGGSPAPANVETMNVTGGESNEPKPEVVN